MSDEDKPFEFSAFDLMPEWAQEAAESSKSDKPKFEKEFRDEEKHQRGRRDKRQGGGGRGNQRNDRFQRDDRGRHPRSGGDRDRGKGGRGRGRDDRRSYDRPREEPLPEGISLTVQPTPEAARSLSQHIHTTLRAFPLVDLAKMVLGSRQRYQVKFTSSKGQLFQCKTDGSLWLTREEAVSHFLHSDAVSNYYRVEEIDTGPPKGTFNSVAVCGMSGVLLGPPNHHEYQRNVAKLHAERFSHMPFEKYRSRIRMENDEETIEKWKESVSKKRQYRPGKAEEEEPPSPEEATEAQSELVTEESVPAEESVAEAEAPQEESETAEETPEQVAEESGVDTESEVIEPEADGEEASETAAEDQAGEDGETEEDAAEPEAAPVENEKEEKGPVLKSEDELARHFRQNFADEEILSGSTFTVSGDIPGRNLSRGLLGLLKADTEKLRRGFPLPMIQSLCKELEKEGLKFFKRGKKALHVCLVRPRAIADADSFTDRVHAIVEYVREHPRALVIDLLDSLVEEFQKPKQKEKAAEIELSEDAKKVLRDLHWLKSEGYVLEFADTRLMLGRDKPADPPAKKAKKEPKSEKKREKKEPSRKPKKSLPVAKTSSPPGSDDLIEMDAADSDPHDPHELPDSVNPVP